MRVQHPYALDDDAPEPDGTVHWGGRRRWSDVDDDGTFHVPDDQPHDLERWAEGYGYNLETLIVEEPTDEEAESGPSAEASDETTSGSDEDDEAVADATPGQQIDAGVCPWCDDYEGPGVPQHASAAHPDEWATYKED